MSGGGQRPAPVRDLDTPEEIAEMVRRFYQDVAQDDLLGPLFNDVAQVDWSTHLPKLAAFWCRALLGLFHDTVELGWTGPVADRALALANNVARVHSGQLLGEPIQILRVVS